MKPDPMDVLSAYYAKLEINNDEQFLPAVFKSRGKRKQKMLGATCGFVVGGAVAILVLSWATHPGSPHQNSDAGFMTRIQMVNSGLVSRTSGTSHEVTR